MNSTRIMAVSRLKKINGEWLSLDLSEIEFALGNSTRV